MLRQRFLWKFQRYRRQFEESLDNFRNLWRGRQVTTRMCPSCRALVDLGEKYCPHCHQKLGYRASGVGKVLQNLVPNFSAVSYVALTLNFLFFVIIFLSQRDYTGQDLRAFLMGGNIKSIVQWGGDVPLLVYHGQWWRLISAIFIHIGIIHLLFNSYALIFIGPLLEESLGRERFLVLYIATGVFGFLVSNMYYSPIQVTAGASGAIFGLIGAGIILSRRWAAWGHMLKDQLVHWAIYGLVYGFLVGANNAAHLGGFISGMGFAYLLRNPASIRPSEESLWTVLFWVVSLLTLASLALACFSGLSW
ncbi:MAG: rhomboid family intramembrane serine protease [Terriglobia bacterium]